MESSKKVGRDLIEYILLISFVSMGSSFVFVSQIKAARIPQKSSPGMSIPALAKTPKRNVIFGSPTKRHIK
jgi:hypothetical protein